MAEPDRAVGVHALAVRPAMRDQRRSCGPRAPLDTGSPERSSTPAMPHTAPTVAAPSIRRLDPRYGAFTGQRQARSRPRARGRYARVVPTLHVVAPSSSDLGELGADASSAAPSAPPRSLRLRRDQPGSPSASPRAAAPRSSSRRNATVGRASAIASTARLAVPADEQLVDDDVRAPVDAARLRLRHVRRSSGSRSRPRRWSREIGIEHERVPLTARCVGAWTTRGRAAMRGERASSGSHVARVDVRVGQRSAPSREDRPAAGPG